MTEPQVIYIAEYESNAFRNAGTGGFDWSHNQQEILDCFNRNISIVGDSHDCALYRISLPGEWDDDMIQAWCEDHINCIPKVDINYNPRF